MQISASILSAELENLTAVTARLEEAKVDMLHYDVMDGHFVPNLTFGAPVLAAVHPHTNLFLDVHLMISDPLRYIDDFVKAGADLITFHIESNSDSVETIQKIHDAGIQAGIVLKPATPWEAVKPYLPFVDVVLIMTVEPGFGGQSFIWEMVDKISSLHKYVTAQNLSCRIEVDGGINLKTAEVVLDAGADILVMGSYLFHQTDMAGTVQAVHQLAARLSSNAL